jgi:hypothetical protein
VSHIKLPAPNSPIIPTPDLPSMPSIELFDPLKQEKSVSELASELAEGAIRARSADPDEQTKRKGESDHVALAVGDMATSVFEEVRDAYHARALSCAITRDEPERTIDGWFVRPLAQIRFETGSHLAKNSGQLATLLIGLCTISGDVPQYVIQGWTTGESGALAFAFKFILARRDASGQWIRPTESWVSNQIKTTLSKYL